MATGKEGRKEKAHYGSCWPVYGLATAAALLKEGESAKGLLLLLLPSLLLSRQGQLTKRRTQTVREKKLARGIWKEEGDGRAAEEWTCARSRSFSLLSETHIYMVHLTSCLSLQTPFPQSGQGEWKKREP